MGFCHDARTRNLTDGLVERDRTIQGCASPNRRITTEHAGFHKAAGKAYSNETMPVYGK